MTTEKILSAFTRILRELLLDDLIALGMQSRREDIPEWDSFSYINFIVAVEMQFAVKFRIADIESFPDVGSIVTQVARMLATIRSAPKSSERTTTDAV